MGIRHDALMGIEGAERKVVGGDGQDFTSRSLTYGYDQPRKSRRDAANLGIAILCALLFLVTASFAALDSNFATSVQMTAAIRQALGMPARSEPKDGTQGGKFILVAEKDNGQRLIAKTALERCGYAVELADDAPEAVALFRMAAPRVSLVVLDWAELRNSTMGVVGELREIRPDVRILISQLGDQQLPAGVTRIPGPLSAPPLTETVRRVLASN